MVSDAESMVQAPARAPGAFRLPGVCSGSELQPQGALDIEEHSLAMHVKKREHTSPPEGTIDSPTYRGESAGRRAGVSQRTPVRSSPSASGLKHSPARTPEQQSIVANIGMQIIRSSLSPCNASKSTTLQSPAAACTLFPESPLVPSQVTEGCSPEDCTDFKTIQETVRSLVKLDLSNPCDLGIFLEFFIRDQCSRNPTDEYMASSLWSDFRQWLTEQAGVPVMGFDRAAFKSLMCRQPGISWKRTKTGNIYVGCGKLGS